MQDIMASQDLVDGKNKIVKQNGKQILLLRRNGQIFACNNRCPHEGYPLSEGSVDASCQLTCNWHNWKFNLRSGENVTGGDHLRLYPTREVDGRIWIDLSDPPLDQLQETAQNNLHQAMDRHEYDRIARELARYMKAGGDAIDMIAAAFSWTHDRLEFGATHALGAAHDWLQLSDAQSDPALKLAPLVEILGHLSWDSLRHPAYPFTEEMQAYNTEKFLAAVEAEDENAAIALIRGALDSGLRYGDISKDIATAAFAHYNDFGHSAIYALKIGRLLERLENRAAQPILFSYIRALIYASREDLIPEFRDYAKILNKPDEFGDALPSVSQLLTSSPRQAMALTAAGLKQPEHLFRVLQHAAAWQFLHFDTRYQADTRNTIQDNVGWLDFTHAITFSNAIHNLAQHYPTVWPQALLQLACFIGRNQSYVDRDLDSSVWRVNNISEFINTERANLIDHGQFEYLISAHLIKTLNAVDEEIEQSEDAELNAILCAGLNRFLNATIKRRHPVRTAHQALGFVALEG